MGNICLDWTKNHPVSNVIWVKTELVQANDYNPNSVAMPEMKLLEHSIETDGFTQPIVVWSINEHYEVVDGFHRHLVGKKLGMSHLPVVVINLSRTDRNDRIAATIRHNRARGKHQVDKMSDIVMELHRRNWSDEKIARELGMEPDEVLRLKQITGLAEMFSNREFSEAWVDDGISTRDASHAVESTSNAAAALGASRSQAKAETSRTNGQKGGRPRKVK